MEREERGEDIGEGKVGEEMGSRRPTSKGRGWNGEVEGKGATERRRGKMKAVEEPALQIKKIVHTPLSHSYVI